MNEADLYAIGGSLDPDLLHQSYLQGIFPWYEEPPILWWRPASRAIITLESLHISRTMRPLVNQFRLRNSKDNSTSKLTLTTDQCFTEIMKLCRNTHQIDNSEGWISDEMIEAYQQLHHNNHAHSFELWLDDTIIAGVYGVHCNRVFSAESMFSRYTNASKLLLIRVCQCLFQHHFVAIDCQVPNHHTASLGTTMVSAKHFSNLLNKPEVQFPTLNLTSK